MKNLHLALVCLTALLLTAPQASVTKTWSAGEVLNAGDLNQNFTDDVNNINSIDDDNVSAAADIDPTKLDAHQDSIGEAQTHTDPFPGDVFTITTTLALEIQELRFQLRAIADQDNDNWYESLENVGFSTGDIKFTIKTAADVGWVLLTDAGTIGNASSGATRANADTEELFELLWNNEAIANTGTVTNITANGGTITAISIASPAVVTDVGHGLTNGDTIVINATDSSPSLDGTRTVTRIDADSFSVGVNTTASGAGTGTWLKHFGIASTDAIIVDAAHGLQLGDIIEVAGSDSTPTINGTRTVTGLIDANTFSTAVTITDDGTTATWIRNFILDGATIVAKSGDASSQIAFDANRRLVLPAAIGRVLAVSGTGAGLTARTLFQVGGREGALLPAHSHSTVISATTSVAPVTGFHMNATAGGTIGEGTGIVSEGRSVADSNMPPALFLNVLIKL